MRNQSLFRRGLAVLAISSAVITVAPVLDPPSAQESKLDKKHQSNLARAVQNLNMADRDLTRLKPDTSINSINNIAKRLEKASQGLEKVPDGFEGKADAQARLDALRLSQQEALATKESAEGSRAENIQLLQQLTAKGEMEDIQKFLTTADELASQMKFMDYTESHLSNERHDMALQYAKYAAAYPPAYERVLSLKERFGDFHLPDLRDHGSRALELLLLTKGEKFDEAWQNLENFNAAAIDLASDRLDVGAQLANDALAQGNPGELLSNPDIIGVQTYIVNISNIYSARPDKSADISARYEALNDRLEETIAAAQQEAITEIVAANKPVKDNFRQSDRAKVEAMVKDRWKQAYPDDEILQVRIPNEEWIRRSEPGWMDGLFVLLQYSIITPYVITEEEGGLAATWGMVAEKDHLQDDEISISFGRLRTEKLDPRYVVLKSALD